MRHFKQSRPSFTRREAIFAASAVSAFPTAALPTNPVNLAELSSYAAETAKSLAAGRDVELRILIPNGSDANISPVVAAFTQQSGIRVKVDSIALDNINTHLILGSFTDGPPYDIALPATYGMPDLVDAGVIRPFSDYAQRHEPSGLRDNVLYDVGDSFDDELYGFQTDGDTYVMFYNADMLNNPVEQETYQNATGTPLAIPDTWEELDRQMAFFHRPDQGRYGGALFRSSGYLAWEWWVRFHAKGVWPFSPQMQPQIASEQGVAALDELIAATKNLVPNAGQLSLFENWERFSQGDVYCNIGWGGTQKYLNNPQSPMKDKLVFGPTPGGLIKGEVLRTPYFNWGWNYVVSQASPHPEIAYLFSLFASSPDISTLSVREQGGYFDPFRTEHYDDASIRDVYSDAFLDVHRDSLQGSIPDLYLANQSEYFSVLNTLLDAALNAEVTPEVALDRVAQEWTLITIRAGVEQQSQRWERLRQKYPPNVRQRLKDLS